MYIQVKPRRIERLYTRLRLYLQLRDRFRWIIAKTFVIRVIRLYTSRMEIEHSIITIIIIVLFVYLYKSVLPVLLVYIIGERIIIKEYIKLRKS